MRHVHAIDLFLIDMEARCQPSAVRKYRRELFEFVDFIGHEALLGEETHEDCLRFLGRKRHVSNTTRGTMYSMLNSYFRFLVENGYLRADQNPMAGIRRARRLKPEDVPVVTTAGEDVQKLILGCRDFQELICIGAAGYLGRRRAALARARRSDADLERGLIRFVDKGGKVIHQPVPDEFLAVLREAEQHDVWQGPDDYLIPNRRRATTDPHKRSSKIVYETVQKVAERVGVKTHVHALRAAFATHFLEANPGRIESLKELMGHDRIETTYVYLRRMNRARAMEDVRDLSWIPEPSGFRSVQERRIRDSNPCSSREPVPDPLKAKLAELRQAQKRETRKTRARE